MFILTAIGSRKINFDKAGNVEISLKTAANNDTTVNINPNWLLPTLNNGRHVGAYKKHGTAHLRDTWTTELRTP